MVDDVGNDPTLPEGTGLQSADDPYVSSHPKFGTLYGYRSRVTTLKG